MAFKRFNKAERKATQQVTNKFSSHIKASASSSLSSDDELVPNHPLPTPQSSTDTSQYVRQSVIEAKKTFIWGKILRRYGRKFKNHVSEPLSSKIPKTVQRVEQDNMHAPIITSDDPKMLHIELVASLKIAAIQPRSPNDSAVLEEKTEDVTFELSIPIGDCLPGHADETVKSRQESRDDGQIKFPCSLYEHNESSFISTTLEPHPPASLKQLPLWLPVATSTGHAQESGLRSHAPLHQRRWKYAHHSAQKVQTPVEGSCGTSTDLIRRNNVTKITTIGETSFFSMIGFMAYGYHKIFTFSSNPLDWFGALDNTGSFEVHFINPQFEKWVGGAIFRLLRPDDSVLYEALLCAEAVKDGLAVLDIQEEDADAHSACRAYLAEVEADYEAAANIMEQRHETELLNLTDDHLSELAEVESKFQTQLHKQRNRFVDARNLNCERHKEVFKLRAELRKYEELYSSQTFEVQNLRNGNSDLEAKLASHRGSCSNAFESWQIDRLKEESRLAREREAQLGDALDESKCVESALRQQMDSAQRTIKQLEIRNRAILTNRRMDFAKRGFGDVPNVLEPDELKDAEQALVVSQQLSFERGELLSRAKIEIEVLDQKVAEANTENVLLREEIQRLETATILAQDYESAYVRLAKEMTKVGEGEDITAEVQESLNNTTEKEAQLETRLRENRTMIVSLKRSANVKKREFEQQLAIREVKIQELEELVIELDKEKFFLVNQSCEDETTIENLRQGNQDLLKESNQLKDQILNQAYGADAEFIDAGYKLGRYDLEQDVRTMQDILYEQSLQTKYLTRLDLGTRAMNMLHEMDLARVLQNERDAALIEVAALKKRFAAGLDEEPLIYNPNDYVIKDQPGEQAVIAAVKEALPMLLKKEDKVDPEPSDFEHLRRPAPYERVSAAVSVEKRKRLAAEAQAAQVSNDLSWVTISTEDSSSFPAEDNGDGGTATNGLSSSSAVNIRVAITDDHQLTHKTETTVRPIEDQSSSVIRFWENECF